MPAEVDVGRWILLLGAVGLWACQSAEPQRGAGWAPQGNGLALVAQAQMALAEGEVERGVQLFRQALQVDPTNLELREEFGLALANAGLDAQAIEELKLAGPSTPEGEAVLGLLLAGAATSQKELQEAAAHLEKGLAFSPASSRVRQVLIQSWLRLGEGEKAYQLIRPLLEEQPENPMVRFWAGQGLRLAGKPQEAVPHLEKARQAPELAERATGELVETYAQLGKYREAAQLVEEMVGKGGAPTLPGLVRWATLLLRAGEVERAAKVLDEALLRDPNLTDALLLRALVCLRQGRLEEAEQLYRRALAVAPEDPDALMGLARLLVDLRRLPEARQVLAQLGELGKKQGWAESELSRQVWQEQATVEILARQWDAALPFLQQLARFPLDRRTIALWAEYFRSQEQYKAGREFFTQAQVEEEPESQRLRRAALAEFAWQAGDRSGARQLLAQWEKGTVEEVRLAVGVFTRVKEYQAALDWAEQGLAQFAEDEELMFARAASLERLSRWEEAVVAFRQLLARYPENASALNYLGYMFADKGVHLEEARQLVEKAVTLDPTSGAYLDSLGWVFFRLGDLDRAEKYLVQAVALEPYDATVHEHLGDLYQTRGEGGKAQQFYRRALELKPEEEGQRERIEAKLKELAGERAP